MNTLAIYIRVQRQDNHLGASLTRSILPSPSGVSSGLLGYFSSLQTGPDDLPMGPRERERDLSEVSPDCLSDTREISTPSF